MRTVGIKTLKNRLSEYVRLASAGETILVTLRDRVVAELVPPRSDRAARLDDAALAEAVRQGWIRPPLVKEREPPPSDPVMSIAELLAGIEHDRADR